MLTIFRDRSKKDMERKFETFSNQLAHAFAQIKTDISEMSSKLENQQADVDRINQWVSYLHRYGQRLSDSHTILSRKYEKINENHQKLHSSHTENTAVHTRAVEDLKNRHKELYDQMQIHKAELKNSVNTHLEGHKELTKREIEGLKGWVGHLHTGIDSERQKNESLKLDIETAQQAWNKSFSALRELVSNLKEDNSSLKKDLSDMNRSLDNTSSELKEAKNLVKSHISAPKSEPQAVQQVMAPMMQPVQTISPPQIFPSSGFERHIISRVLPNRRSYVLKFIVDLAAENRFSTKEIESIIVDEKKLCGRTSFYAYLKELKYKGQISTANIDERIIVVSANGRPPQVQKTFDEIVDHLDKSG